MKPSDDEARTEIQPRSRSERTATADLVGRTLDGRYEVLDVIGRGGMGIVYKARHLLLREIVALKVIREGLLERAEVRERFLREARATMKFVHPNVVPVREVGLTADGTLYMTMDYSCGESLRSVLQERGRLPEKRAFAIVRQCLRALEAAHARGIIHRDLKPENILIEAGAKPDDDVVRVLDFGLAKLLDRPADAEKGASLTGSAVIGTPYYMAPEQACGGDADARTDLYAIGCVLYELVTGTKVFDADSVSKILMKHLTQPPEPPSKRAGVGSPKLDALILRALAKEPEERPRSAAELIEALDGIDARLRGTRKLRVLLAEDNVVNQKLTQRMVERWGHSVVVAANGSVALARLAAESFDLVLMDGQMPGMDGFEATKLLRAREGRGPRTPVIGLTATAADRERCLDAGMNEHVTKPIEPEALYESVERATRSHAVTPTQLSDSKELDGIFDTAAALARVEGDVELLEEVIQLFLDVTPRLIAEIEAAIAAGDAARVVRAAYELKGAAGNCGASVVHEAASKLESIGPSGAIGLASKGCAELVEAFGRLRPALVRMKERRIACAC